MALSRRLPSSKPKPKPKPKPERIPHECVPVPGEHGRFYVKSRTAAKKGEDETYIVDVLEENGYQDGLRVEGICPCKGYQVRKICSHLTDAKEAFNRLEAPF